MTNDPQTEELRALLERLTPQPAKVAAYLGDTYFQETVEHLDRFDLDAEEFARSHSILLLKPDAIVARALEPTLQWLADNDFQVVTSARIPVDRHLARALWYFAWNIASPERRRLADLLVGISEVLVLLVRGRDGQVPVPIRLAESKGPTDPRKRVPGQLRYLLGRHNYLLNLVHSPDDPADVLRELSVYFDERTRTVVLSQAGIGGERSAETKILAEQLYAATPARGFDRAEATARILRDVARSGATVGSEFDPVSDSDCARLLYAAWERDLDLDPWSVIVLGSHVLPMRTGTGAQMLRPVSAHDWLEAGL
ncbi:nucleoside-diphosphate kinase [Nocardia callitridis]|uniref:Nucleoside diphosphate kinase-like domain-containing protein n=1 Tax=Nocardia callitridis TaxID=648753 RepID=A0ABP9L0D8_9NOCA